MSFNLELILRILLACILGGIVGFEREHKQRPAGLRTTILVCVGSTLVMITSEFIFQKYKGSTTMDPARLGAQVISGIGFLGAGTILRDGFKVKGLTTAATLWAVACVGIATGIGFYEGAVAATVIIYLTLIALKRFEKYISNSGKDNIVCIESEDIPGQISTMTCVLDKYPDMVTNVEIVYDLKNKNVIAKFHLKIASNDMKLSFVNELHDVKGIQKIYTI